MDIRLAYGKNGLVIHLPDQYELTVIEPVFVPGLVDPSAALQQALASPRGALPLKDFVSSGDRVGIVFSDITRPTPHQLILRRYWQSFPTCPSANHPVQRPWHAPPQHRG